MDYKPDYCRVIKSVRPHYERLFWAKPTDVMVQVNCRTVNHTTGEAYGFNTSTRFMRPVHDVSPYRLGEITASANCMCLEYDHGSGYINIFIDRALNDGMDTFLRLGQYVTALAVPGGVEISSVLYVPRDNCTRLSAYYISTHGRKMYSRYLCNVPYGQYVLDNESFSDTYRITDTLLWPGDIAIVTLC